MRRQLTLFLPPDRGAIVDPVRLRLDPRQHALIRAHVALCRDEGRMHESGISTNVN